MTKPLFADKWYGPYVLTDELRKEMQRVYREIDTFEALPGPQGPTGPQGPEGPTGPQGEQGIQGPQGEIGPTGPQGPQGLTGATGPQGPQGIQGEQGIQGVPGDDGSLIYSGEGPPSAGLGVTRDVYLDVLNGNYYIKGANWDVGGWNTTTWDANTWSDPQQWKGDTGPQGPQGATGPTGPQGPQGIQGETGLTGPTGPQGPQGIQGATGPTGPQGPAGTDGATWREGTGAPSNALGVDGDFYLDDATGDVYQRAAGTYSVVANIRGIQGIQGPQGIQGATGPAGADGKTVLSGTVNPTTEGVDGDFYINTSTSTIFGPKAAGVWPAGVSMIGPQGPTGATGPQGPQGDTGPTGPTGPQGVAGEDGADILTGEGAPSSLIGVAGDIYLDVQNGNYYVKGADWDLGVWNNTTWDSNAWSSAIQWKGDTGPQGPQGPQGIQGIQGIQGETGATGPQGPAGTPGEVWFNGAGAPSGATGIVGDYYINTSNGDYYEKTGASTWTLLGNLTGPTGPQGPTGPTGPQGPQGDPGEGVPVGGTTGQVLKKASATNYDTVWADESGGGSYLPLSGGTLTGDLTLETDHPHIRVRNTNASYLGKNFEIANYQAGLMVTKVDGTTWQANILKLDWTTLAATLFGPVEIAYVPGTSSDPVLSPSNAGGVYWDQYGNFRAKSTVGTSNTWNVIGATGTMLSVPVGTSPGNISMGRHLTLGNMSIVEVENIYLDNLIYSVGDTDTYMQFHAADQWRVVTGGNERIEANNTDGIYMWGARVSGRLVIPVK